MEPVDTEKTSSKDDDLLQEALSLFQADLTYWQPEYLRAQDDIDFSLGRQWPDKVRADREADGRPCLTENRIDVSCIQTINDIRQTRPSINVIPQDDKADVETAKVLKGIVRNIEQQSNANNAYDTAAENQVRGGYGWIRVNTQYANEDSFDQEIVIDMIENPFSVLIDSGSRKLDGSDMRRAFIFTDMPRDEFEARYPDKDPVSFEPTIAAREWCTPNTVRVAEYFYKDEEKYTLVRTPVGDMDKKDAKKLGLTWDKERKTCRTIIKWCKFTAKDVLGKTTWPGKHIPVVPVYGKVVWGDGRRKSFSLTYQGRDPQIRYNFMITAETEWSCLQPKAPWLAYEDQVTGPQAQKFAESNIKNHAILFHKATYDKNNNLLPPPIKQQPPSGSPALMQQALVAADGVKATLGIYEASLGQRGNETSGRAILARQAEGDNATFHFVDNLATSIRQVGRIIVDLIPKIYSDKTIARILGDDNEPRMVPLNQPVIKQGKEFLPLPDGMPEDVTNVYHIAPDAGKYDVSVTIGPSYASKRQEMTANMFELYKMAPQLLEVTGDIFFRNLDWDGAQEIAERAKKILPPQFQDESPEQAQLMQAQEQIQAMGMQLQQMEAALKQKQDNQAFSNEIESQKVMLQHNIDQQKIEIEKEKLALETLKAQGEITPEQTKAMIAAIAALNDNLNDVGQAVSLILDDIESNSAPAAPEAVAIPQGDNVV